MCHAGKTVILSVISGIILGLEFPVDRVAISIGNFNIYWYGIIIAVAFAMGLWVYLSHNRRCGIHPDEGLDVILWAMLGAIVGARAYYVAFRWDSYKNNPAEIFNLRGGGLAIYGGIPSCPRRAGTSAYI